MLSDAIFVLGVLGVQLGHASSAEEEPGNGFPGLRELHRPAYLVAYEPYESTCTEERCNDVAELFLRSVRKSINPCDDFHGYACGRRQGKMRSLTKEIREILEQQPNGEAREETKSLALERRFYRSCMEQRESDYKTGRELARLLRLSNGLSLFAGSAANFGSLDWRSIDSLYASLGFEHAFFDVHVIRDPKHHDVNLIALGPPSLMYLHSVELLLRNENFMVIVLNLLKNYDSKGVAYLTDYQDVISFVKELNLILPVSEMFEENITTLINHKTSINEWQKIYDSATDDEYYSKYNIDWLRLLNSYLKSANIHIDRHEKVVLKTSNYFTKLAQLLKATPPATVEKYIHLRFLARISTYLSPSLAQSFENVNDRSTFCIKKTGSRLVGATYEYIKRHVPREQKIYAEKVIKNVRNALIDLISERSDWMDAETKVHAINKLKNLDILVGYPDWQIDRSFINNYYGNLHLHSNLFENAIKYKRKLMIQELRGLKHPRVFDPTTMSKALTPLIYHFGYDNYANRIFYPTEYLNENKYKLFSTKLPSAINYGSFGSMIGSILYDYVSLTDNLRNEEFYIRTSEGLTRSTITAYQVKEKCLSNQLINYKKSSSKFERNLAWVIDSDTIQVDKTYEKMAGLRAAFEAYKRLENQSGERLPGFEDLNDHQLLFLSYAERICEVGDVYDKYDAYEMSLKVNGVLSNLQSFSDVYRCSRRSPMNRPAKCELFS